MTTQATKKEKNAAYHKIKLFIAQTSVEQGFLPLRKKSYLNISEDMNHFYLYCEERRYQYVHVRYYVCSD